MGRESGGGYPPDPHLLGGAKSERHAAGNGDRGGFRGQAGRRATRARLLLSQQKEGKTGRERAGRGWGVEWGGMGAGLSVAGQCCSLKTYLRIPGEGDGNCPFGPGGARGVRPRIKRGREVAYEGR